MKMLRVRVWDNVARIYRKLGSEHDYFETFEDGSISYRNYQNGAGGSEVETELFTGSKDCEKNELYDNDILMNKETQVGSGTVRNVYYRIFFNESCSCWMGTRSFAGNDGKNWSECPLSTLISLGATKIGNIHQTAICNA